VGFIVIEGIECSGKSTLLPALAEKLRAEGAAVVVTREPGGTPLGDAVRSIFLDRTIEVDALTEAFLMNAARARHVAETIRPALADGRTVLCDRYTDSTLAYQGYGRGLDLTMLRDLCDTATGGLKPVLTLLVDVPVRVSRERMLARASETDRLEREDDAFHERVRNGFLELAASPDHRVIDGMLAAPDVLERALRAVTSHSQGNL
jgi:dTMP kinase